MNVKALVTDLAFYEPNPDLELDVDYEEHTKYKSSLLADGVTLRDGVNGFYCQPDIDADPAIVFACGLYPKAIRICSGLPHIISLSFSIRIQ